MRLLFLTSAILCTLPIPADAFDWDSLNAEMKKQLEAGKVVTFQQRPDEKAEAEVDARFTTIGQVLQGTQKEIWDVIHDKEDAELFVDGVLESKVLSQSEKEILVEQRTHVGGPKGSYYYQLRHQLTPNERSDFQYVTGEMRDVVGTWWIIPAQDADHCLVVYSLFIDPGAFAPQFIVRKGMKKSMPGTIQSMQREVLKRRSE